jgi:hypothetical protein
MWDGEGGFRLIVEAWEMREGWTRREEMGKGIAMSICVWS